MAVVVEGYYNGVSYTVTIGVDQRRANDGIVAGDPRIIGMLQTMEGLPMTLGPGRRSVTGTTMNADWVLAALHKNTQVTDVDGPPEEIPDLRVVRRRSASGAPVY